MKIPERTKDNSDYVDSIIKAKRAVALDEPIEVKNNAWHSNGSRLQRV